MSDMDALIRAAAGRAPAPAAGDEPETGDLGIGRGGAAIARRPEPVTMDALIRGTAAYHRSGAHAFAELYVDQESAR